MTDTWTKEFRSEIMSRIHSKNTKPEMLVRRLIHGMGYRYRLHVKELPGTPDIVMISKRKIVEVRGCFWHGHAGCTDARIPKTRSEFWVKKINSTKKRDASNSKKLEMDGWEILEIWECELRNVSKLKSRISTFINKENLLNTK